MRWARPALVAVAVVALWQAVAAASSLAGPGPAASRLLALLQERAFRADIAATAVAFGWAAALSILGGLLLGGALALDRLAAAVLEPFLLGFYGLPKVVLYPVVLLLFGLGPPAKIAFGVMHGLVPLALLTVRAVAALPPILARTGRVMRLSPGAVLLRILLPAVLPDVLAGVRLAVSLSLLGVLIGEMFASSSGLGHRAMTAMGNGDVPAVLAIAALLAGSALALNAALMALARLGRGP